MNRTVLAIAPHPDDEMLGCGGTLLRHVAEGDQVHWLIVTAMTERNGFSTEAIEQRQTEIEAVTQAAGFSARHELGFPTARLDSVPLADVVSAIGAVIRETGADTLYLPYGGDVHSDHGVVFAAARGCSKWFRYPGVRRIYAYETPSETDFALPPDGPGMPVNRFVDISNHLERKLEILTCYEGEMGEFPFPRSPEAIIALARLRGATAGCQAAEAFQVLKEIV